MAAGWCCRVCGRSGEYRSPWAPVPGGPGAACRRHHFSAGTPALHSAGPARERVARRRVNPVPAFLSP